MKIAAACLSLLLACCGSRSVSPLIAAARSGDVAAIQSLLKQGADPNETGGVNGWTALQHAVHKRQPASVEALLQGGAEPDLHSGKWTPLMMAAGYGYDDIVRILLKHGADPALKDPDGRTARNYASSGVGDIDRFTLGHKQTAALQALDEAPPAR